MWFKSFLFLFLSLFIYVDAQGNCNVTDDNFVKAWENGDLWIEIKDDDINFKVDIKTENIKGIELVHKYIDAQMDSIANILTFSVNNEFQNFITNEDDLTMKQVRMLFQCQNGQELNTPKYVTLNVDEVTNYKPEFEHPKYDFKLPMPMIPNQIIESTDMKVTDNNIKEDLSFSFTSDALECTKHFDFVTTRNKKIYTTKLKSKGYVELDKNITCGIQVQDSRNGADKTTINIKVDIANSKVPNPIFKEPIYIEQYTENMNIKVELLPTMYTPIPTIIPNNEFAKYFNVKLLSNNEIELTKDKEIPEKELENINYFVLIVEVEYGGADNTAKTAILIDINQNTAPTTTTAKPTTTQLTTTSDCPTTTIINTTPCDCSTTTPVTTLKPGDTTTISTTSETDSSSCTTCPDCTTTIDPGNITTCPSCPDCTTTIDPGNITTCPSSPDCTTTIDPGNITTCPSCPDCTTTIDPGNITTCPSSPDCTTTIDPGNITTCPSCPDCTTINPGNTTTSPNCPDCTTIDPGDTTTCASCPDCTTINPGNTTTSPNCPDCTTIDPGDTTTCASCPDCTTTDPGNTTTCSSCPTTCPDCPQSTAPGESTTTPSDCECDCSTSIGPTTCEPSVPAPKVRFQKKSAFHNRGKGTTGKIDTFKAVSDISNEEITYNINSVTPKGATGKFEITNVGEVNIKEEVDEGIYDISLSAIGKQSKSQDEAMLYLLIKAEIVECPDNTSVQVERLTNIYVKEGDKAKKIIDAKGNYFEITDDNDDIHDWFKINANGDLEIQEINREDKRIKSLGAPQIQVKIQAMKKNTPPPSSYNSLLTHSDFKNAEKYSQPEYSCMSIRDIDMKPNTMLVLVSVEDINDNPPVFTEMRPLVVGYPEPKLIDLIAPPYLVKVTATDDDIGDHAKIKYTTTSENFIADADNGIIFVGKELSDNSEFKIIAEDNDGNGGNKAELSVKVKLLKEEHISIITMENVEYSEVEDKVNQISLLTKQTVKYLTSTALPKIQEDKMRRFNSYAKDEKIPAFRVVLYALDKNNEIISAKEFKKIADDIDIGIEIDIKEYVAMLPSPDEDTTGWIAAVSTISVLLALVIIGSLLGYIFYVRPRIMQSSSDGYIKHTNQDSTHIAPIETKMDSSTTLSDRRPTGFPIGFTPKDLDEEDDYDELVEEDNKTEIVVEEDESINNSKILSNTQSERKKSGVKFDTNVTEIEIEEF